METLQDLTYIHLIENPLDIVAVGDRFYKPSSRGHYCIVPFLITEVSPKKDFARYKLPFGKAQGELRKDFFEREPFIGMIQKVRKDESGNPVGLEQYVDAEMYRRLTGKDVKVVASRNLLRGRPESAISE